MSLLRHVLRPMRFGAFLALVATARPAGAQSDEPFLRVRVDDARNRALLEIPAAQLNREFLHQVTLTTGLGTGSLDRATTGPSAIVRLERRGNRVLMIRDNWSVRAPNGDAANQRAAAEAFPRSVVGSFPVESDNAGVLTVDATSLFLADAYGVADGLRGQGGGGAYRVDAARSYLDGDRTRSFPRNAEVHAVLTFVGDQPNRALSRVAPDPRALTFEEHHSLVVLPDRGGFRPRDYDPRYGFFGTQFADLSEGFDGDYRAGYINRWRLIPRDPAAYARGELVEPVTPITYYLDPGIPAPYREALREGGNWWAKVFEAAGFRNAFRVLDLPAGADPMDARYNMLMWVHRTGPGPSVGPSYSDPRTGEIIRAVVRMDAWRSLVDYNIWAGTVPAFGAAGPSVSAEAFVMARRRQHAAHEIGHTIGLQHNYIASSQGRTSVMDYPFPLITLDASGGIDLRDAYRSGPGAWDSLAIRFGYTWYPDAGAEKAGLAAIMKDGFARNVRFINDTYANANGSIPEVTRWDEGATMFDAVTRSSKVRRVLMDKFDERAIQPGEPMALLNMRFAHVYLHHRYSLEGLSKYVGGMDFTFAMRGDGQVPTRVIPAAEQRRALAMALDALKPSELTVPERVQKLIPPPPPGFNTDQTWIGGSGGTAFDAITLAGGLATEVIGYLLDRDRTARLVLFAARDPQALTLDEVMRTIVARTWGATVPANPAERAVLRASQRAALDALLDIAGDVRAMPDVRATAITQVRQLQSRLTTMATAGDAAAGAHVTAARHDIQRFLDGNDKPELRPRYPVLTLPWP
ncbi:zinc-dependent metalloprotease [Gemmatimonas aurantiaca]|uniref:zinc-dependent metalloprotease n=1 Tax=Gemmatimonas aurantiaca TaxID=173480 RepID=UPI00301B9921